MGELNEAKWYVVHTRTGYENKVKADLEKTVENRNMVDLIQEIRVPTEEVVEIKDSKRKVSQHKLFPCYILVKMIMTSETWYIVRNATGVTGFVGPGSDPVPLTDDEIDMMGVENHPVIFDFEPGQTVRLCEGPFENFEGVVESVDKEKEKVKVVVKMFGRDTAIDLEYSQIKKL